MRRGFLKGHWEGTGTAGSYSCHRTKRRLKLLLERSAREILTWCKCRKWRAKDYSPAPVFLMLSILLCEALVCTCVNSFVGVQLMWFEVNVE